MSRNVRETEPNLGLMSTPMALGMAEGFCGC